MGASPIIKPTKDLVEAVKAKTDNLPADPGGVSDITGIKQKATSPAWDQDTDSLEAIREKVDGISTAIATVTGVIVEDTTGGGPDLTIAVSSATANTFGSWVEIDSGVPADSWICGVTVCLQDTVTKKIVVVLGTGAAGSEATKIRFSWELVGTDVTTKLYSFVYPVVIPIKVASGVRIAARAADNDANIHNYNIGVQYYQNL